MTSGNLPTLGALLHEIDRLIRRRFDRYAETTGMSRAQWHVLARVARHEGINQATLADRIGVEPITVSRMVDRLEALGLIERRPDPADRRARRLHTTEAARPGLRRMRDAVRDIYGLVLEGFSPEDEAMLTALLGRLHGNLLADAGEDSPFENGKLEWLRKQLED